ncbi:MAG: response regulator [Chloroflexota bacterium]
MRIAYVEDNPTNQALVTRVASMNHHVIVAYSEGEIARTELMQEKFDLILMDVELAGEINGLQVVKHLREHGLRTPIVAVTAYAMMGDRDKCLEAGCDDYLPKPLPITSLLELLDRYEKLSVAKAADMTAPTVSEEAQPAPASPVPESLSVTSTPELGVPVVAPPESPSVTPTPVTPEAAATPAIPAAQETPTLPPSTPVTPETTAAPALPVAQETPTPTPTAPLEPPLPATDPAQAPENLQIKEPSVQKDAELAPTLPTNLAEPPISRNGATEPKLPNEG